MSDRGDSEPWDTKEYLDHLMKDGATELRLLRRKLQDKEDALREAQDRYWELKARLRTGRDEGAPEEGLARLEKEIERLTPILRGRRQERDDLIQAYNLEGRRLILEAFPLENRDRAVKLMDEMRGAMRDAFRSETLKPRFESIRGYMGLLTRRYVTRTSESAERTAALDQQIEEMQAEGRQIDAEIVTGRERATSVRERYAAELRALLQSKETS